MTKRKAEETSIIDAVKQGDIDLAREILASDKNAINIKTEGDFLKGHQAIHFACFLGYYEIVELLIDHNAKINIPGFNKHTPLMEAARAGHSSIMLLLLATKKAITHWRGSDGHTAFSLAIDNCKIDAIKVLLKYGMPIDSFLGPVKSILGPAIFKEDKGMLKFLLSKGADIKAGNLIEDLEVISQGSSNSLSKITNLLKVAAKIDEILGLSHHENLTEISWEQEEKEMLLERVNCQITLKGIDKNEALIKTIGARLTNDNIIPAPIKTIIFTKIAEMLNALRVTAVAQDEVTEDNDDDDGDSDSDTEVFILDPLGDVDAF